MPTAVGTVVGGAGPLAHLAVRSCLIQRLLTCCCVVLGPRVAAFGSTAAGAGARILMNRAVSNSTGPGGSGSGVDPLVCKARFPEQPAGGTRRAWGWCPLTGAQMLLK